jgi:hypothetical protein
LTLKIFQIYFTQDLPFKRINASCPLLARGLITSHFGSKTKWCSPEAPGGAGDGARREAVTAHQTL